MNKERIDVTLLGVYSMAGGIMTMVTMFDISERFAFCGGGVLIAAAFLSWSAVLFDIYKSRIKVKIMQQIKAANGYHILRTFRKIYKEL